MGYEWLPLVLARLHGVEPYEVMHALTKGRRWPRPALGADGVAVLTIWVRTRAGQPLIVTLRPTGISHDWQIVGVTVMTADQAAEYDRWEADNDQ